jgi:hypothetical protein
VVWEQEGEIMLVASHDGGETWGAIVNVSNTPGAFTDPRVATSANGQYVHVTWQDTPGNGDIFYARSTNRGETFETSINLSNTSGRSDDHQLLAEGSNVYVVWVDYTTRSGGDIYFRKSNNNGGETFSNTINLSGESGQSFQAARDPVWLHREAKYQLHGLRILTEMQLGQARYYLEKASIAAVLLATV